VDTRGPGSAEVLRLPAPTGPFAIGSASYHLVDRARPERFTFRTDDVRELMVQVWYPAAAQTASARVLYVDDVRTLRPLARMMGLPETAFDRLAGLQTNAGWRLPVASDEARYPVLVFSHGRCGFRQHNSVQVEALVSHGFVVAAIDHPRVASGVALPGGRIVPFDPRLLPPWPRSETLDVAFEDVIGYLVEDLRFVLDRLEELDREDPLDALTDRLDLGRIGAFGPSLGGRVAAQAALDDPRIGAVLCMDIAMPAPIVAGELRRPMLWMSRDEATMVREGWSRADIDDTQSTMRLAFERLPDDGYLVLVPGMFHPDFSDGRLLSPLLVERGITGPIDGARARAVLDDYAVAFFDRHLRGGRARLLDGPSPAFPEVQFAARSGLAVGGVTGT
jgi:predicted dienelactone hydrolase